MRDNSKELIELISATDENDSYFSIVAVPDGTERRRFRFGISRQSYTALKKILQARPLDSMPGVKYRFFWDRSLGGKTGQNIFLGIRCEIEGNGKRFDFEVPQELAANLKWISELKSLDEARHLELET